MKRSNIDHPDLEIANKYLDSLKKAGGTILDTRKYDQAKRNPVVYIYYIIIFIQHVTFIQPLNAISIFSHQRGLQTNAHSVMDRAHRPGHFKRPHALFCG